MISNDLKGTSPIIQGKFFNFEPTAIAFLNKRPTVIKVIPSFEFEMKIPQACHFPSSCMRSKIDPSSML